MPLRDLLRSHPFLGTLRWIKRPTVGSRVELTVEALCRNRAGVVITPDLDITGLPADKAIAAQLGIAEATVRSYLEQAARGIQGLEALHPRARIYCVYWHTHWVEGLPPERVAAS